MLRDFLPRYNTQFAVPAELYGPTYHPWHRNRPLDEILCIKHTRKVARDNTVHYPWRTAIENLMKSDTPALPEYRLQDQVRLTLHRPLPA